MRKRLTRRWSGWAVRLRRALGLARREVPHDPHRPASIESLEQRLMLSAWTTGAKDILYIRVDTADLTGAPVSEEAVRAEMDEAGAWFASASNGLMTIADVDVTPTLRLPNDSPNYLGRPEALRDDAAEAAERAGYSVEGYWSFIVATGGNALGSHAGWAWVGQPGVVLERFDADLMIHELGHALGLWHSGFWDTDGPPTDASGVADEYGNPFDKMGRERAGGDFSAAWKAQLGWLSDKQIEHVSPDGGTFTLHAVGDGPEPPDTLYALRVARGETAYWLEYRTGAGVLVNGESWLVGPGQANDGRNLWLLDTTPGSDPHNDAIDAGLRQGGVYVDSAAGLAFTVLSEDLSTGTVQVQVAVAARSGNTRPTGVAITSAAIPENLSAGQAVGVLSASDGDVAETFTYTVINNVPFTAVGNTLRTTEPLDYETARRYAVRVRARDSTGASIDRTLFVNVEDGDDAPTDVRLLGGVVSENGPAGRVVGTLLAPDPDRVDSVTFSLVPGDGDADNARFAIDGQRLVTTGPLDFEAGATRTVRVRATDASGLFIERPFTVQVRNIYEPPTVSLRVIDDTTSETHAEQGDAVVRISREGGDTAPLRVGLRRSGMATPGPRSDYQVFVDGRLAPWASAVFAPGQDSVDLVIRANDDARGEGVETLVLTLAPSGRYTAVADETLRTAQVAILDNEPVVTIEAVNPLTTESPGDAPATLLLTRDTAEGSLAVRFAVGGSARRGPDYHLWVAGATTPLRSNSVSFADGQSTLLLRVVALDDNRAEGDERVIVTLLPGGEYALPADEFLAWAGASIQDHDARYGPSAGSEPA